MKYYSTRNRGLTTGFREAVRQGLAPDGGLFLPENIPGLPHEFFAHVSRYSLTEIGMHALRDFIPGEIGDDLLYEVLDKALDFPVPLVKVSDRIHALELFHGPTLAFKDVGARFMGNILPYCMDQDKEILVLVATSGDTGSAVAHGFYMVPGVRVVVLYPRDKVSTLQELQMTTLGENIIAAAVEGTFDDCQMLVKNMFTDSDLNKRLVLTSANSINIARWLPQCLYYFLVLQAIDSPVVSVPSGNLGNFTAGVLAHRMGLPVTHFIAACNANNVVPHYLRTGSFEPKPSIQTAANAMDVGNPSNFERLLELFGGDYLKIKDFMSADSFSDERIKQTIIACWEDNGYILDPHGATAYQALLEDGREGVFLATAHPAKFPGVYSDLDISIEVPESLERLEGRRATSISLSIKEQELKELLLAL